MLSIQGGVKVIKSIVKSKVTENTTTRDRTIYEDAFTMAEQIHSSTVFNVKDALESDEMTLAKIKDIENYLKHDKAPHAVKVARFHEFLSPHVKMNVVQQKLNIAVDNFKNLVKNDLEENHGNEDGQADIGKIREMLTAIIAVKQYRQMESS